MTTVANIKNLPDLIYSQGGQFWGPWDWEIGLEQYQPGDRSHRLRVSRALGRLRAGEVLVLQAGDQTNHVALSPWENQSLART